MRNNCNFSALINSKGGIRESGKLLIKYQINLFTLLHGSTRTIHYKKSFGLFQLLE